MFDALPAVGYAGYGGYGVFHDLERNGANEVLGDFDIIHECVKKGCTNLEL